MSPASLAIVFFFAWWLVLFMLLPIGITPADNPEKGHSTGAPDKAHLKWKLAATTVAAILITTLFFWLTDGILIAPGMPT